MKVITVATHNDGYYNILKESCKRNKLNLVTLGFNQRWKGFTMRYELIKEYLKHIKDNEIILIVDAFDVIILQNEEEIIKKFKKFNKKIVFSVQNGLISKILFRKCNHNVLNQGTYIGYAKYLKLLYKILNKKTLFKKFNNDDQQILNYKCNIKKIFFKKFVGFDIKNDIFYVTDVTSFINPNYLLFGKINLKSNPSVLHLAASNNANKLIKKLSYNKIPYKNIPKVKLYKIEQSIYILKNFLKYNLIFIIFSLIVFLVIKLNI